MDAKPSISVSRSGESEDDSDLTDYEPDQKKRKVDKDTGSGESHNTSVMSNASRSDTATVAHQEVLEGNMEKDENVATNADNVSNINSTNANVPSDVEPKPVTTSSRNTIVLPRFQSRLPLLRSSRSYVGHGLVHPNSEPLLIRSQLGRRITLENVNRRRRRRRGNENETSSDSSSSSSSSSSDYVVDDIDPLEVSDVDLSPPDLPRHHNRQRRNAIFERRDPPPGALLLNEDDRVFQDQLEVASVSDENPIEDENSTSGADEQQPKPILVRNEETTVEETDNNFADVETVRTDVDSDVVPPSSPKSKELLSSDSELSDKDKWVCTQCKSKSMPHFRYCLKCFQMRRSWLPQRPLSRRLKRRKRAEKTSNSLSNSRTTRSSCVSECDDVVDGPVNPQVRNSSLPVEEAHPGSSSNSNIVQRSLPSGPEVNLNQAFLVDANSQATSRISNELPPGNVTILELFSPPQERTFNNDLNVNSTNSTPGSSQTMSAPLAQSQASELSQKSSSSSGGTGSLWSQSSSQSQAMSQTSLGSSATFSESSSMTQEETKTEAKDVNCNVKSLCGICCAREKDAAFVHNKIAHHFCCFPCADKILKQTGKCPICREKVFRVVKIISA